MLQVRVVYVMPYLAELQKFSLAKLYFIMTRYFTDCLCCG